MHLSIFCDPSPIDVSDVRLPLAASPQRLLHVLIRVLVDGDPRGQADQSVIVLP